MLNADLNPTYVKKILVVISLACIALHPVLAQGAKKSTEKTAPKTAFNAATYDSAMLQEFAWRPIGPAVTSGRVVDLAVAEGPEGRVGSGLGKVVYAASASGGVWKTVKGGTRWEPIFDEQST